MCLSNPILKIDLSLFLSSLPFFPIFDCLRLWSEIINMTMPAAVFEEFSLLFEIRVLKNKQFIKRCVQGSGYPVGKLERRVVFSFLQENDGFSPDPYRICKSLLSQVVPCPKLFDPCFHSVSSGSPYSTSPFCMKYHLKTFAEILMKISSIPSTPPVVSSTSLK